MGVQLGDLAPGIKLELSQLRGKLVAIDANNALYQFLSVIRQPDGTPLMDSKGRITSHLSGLFYRSLNLLENGIKPVYVFDGQPPEFKSATIEARRKLREQAFQKWIQAKQEGLIQEAFKYAQASSKLDQQMISESKQLLELMGIPYVQSPCEAEAQSASMALRGEVDYAASQDYDSLLFGAPRLIRNLTLAGKRKLPGRDSYQEISPELVELDRILRQLGITRKQLVEIGILVGTDFNPGIKGIGPKKALKLIKQYGNLERALAAIDHQIQDLEKILEFFLNPPSTMDYKLEWNPIDKPGILRFLCDQHDFSMERVERALERFEAELKKTSQRTLDQWF